jgi:hypothetical protein
MTISGGWTKAFIAGVAFVTACIAGGASFAADSAVAKFEAAVTAGGSAVISAPVLRTLEDISREVPSGPRRPAAAGFIINAPTIPIYEYNALKGQPGLHAPIQQSAGTTQMPPATPYAAVKGVNFTAAIEGENGINSAPPDVHAAVGTDQIVETTNASIDVYSKVASGTPTHIRSFSQASLTGNYDDDLGDARVLYDWNWNRWVITIDDFSNLSNSGLPQYYICVSQTPEATGAYWVSTITFTTNTAGLFFDYPQLGMDQDAVLITFNLFSNTFVGPTALAIAKARVYNGQGPTSIGQAALFTQSASTGTLAPPIVLAKDQNSADFFIAAPVGSGQTVIHRFVMRNAGRTGTTFSVLSDISVASFTTPPANAPQTCGGVGSGFELDTSDGRFVNASIQNGTRLWNTHSIADGARAKVRWYEFSTAGTVTETGNLHLNGTSHDFNASIASASGQDAVMTWSATDPTNSKNAMVIVAGRLSAAPANSMTINSTPLVTSSVCLDHNFDPNFGHERWGDYSSVSVDFATGTLNPSLFYWINNEFSTNNSILKTDGWATRIARVAN